MYKSDWEKPYHKKLNNSKERERKRKYYAYNQRKKKDKHIHMTCTSSVVHMEIEREKKKCTLYYNVALIVRIHKPKSEKNLYIYLYD